MIEVFWFVAMFVVPFGGALVLAAVLGKITRSRFPGVPNWLKISLAGLIAALWPFIFLIIWQLIDVALREARGDTSEYMGPAVILIYLYPITIRPIIASFCIAGYASVGRK